MGSCSRVSYGTVIVVARDFIVVPRNVIPSVVAEWLWRCTAALEVANSILPGVAAFQWGRNEKTLLYLDLGAC